MKNFKLFMEAVAEELSEEACSDYFLFNYGIWNVAMLHVSNYFTYFIHVWNISNYGRDSTVVLKVV